MATVSALKLSATSLVIAMVSPQLFQAFQFPKLFSSAYRNCFPKKQMEVNIHKIKNELMKECKCIFYQYSEFHVFTRQSVGNC